MTAPTSLAASTSTHGPTDALLAALRDNSWGVKWHHGGTAMLVHRTHGTLEVEVDPTDTERLVAFIDGRQVPHRMAMARANGDL